MTHTIDKKMVTQDVLEYLRQHGPTTSDELHAKILPDLVRSSWANFIGQLSSKKLIQLVNVKTINRINYRTYDLYTHNHNKEMILKDQQGQEYPIMNADPDITAENILHTNHSLVLTLYEKKHSYVVNMEVKKQ